jgi:hypothetical protein
MTEYVVANKKNGGIKIIELTPDDVTLLATLWRDYVTMKTCGYPFAYGQHVNGHKVRRLINAGLAQKCVYQTETKMQYGEKEIPYYIPTEQGLTLAHEICTPPVSRIDRACYTGTDTALVTEDTADWTDVRIDMIRRNNYTVKYLEYCQTLDTSHIKVDYTGMDKAFRSNCRILNAMLSLRMN